ncbi:MAG: hypothetical protein IJK29_00570, partial [Bacteroidales bacterium]|nr:hypothetical protein [Bacteroidales bacterium]
MRRMTYGNTTHSTRERLFAWLMALMMILGQGNWRALAEGEPVAAETVIETVPTAVETPDPQPETPAQEPEAPAAEEQPPVAEPEAPAQDAEVPAGQVSEPETPEQGEETPAQEQVPVQEEVPAEEEVPAQEETPAEEETPDEQPAAEGETPEAGSADEDAHARVLWHGFARVSLAEDETVLSLYQDGKSMTAKGTLRSGAVVSAVQYADEERLYVSFWADGEPWFGYVEPASVAVLTEEEAEAFVEENEGLIVVDRRNRSFYDMTPYFTRNAALYPKAQPAQPEEPASEPETESVRSEEPAAEPETEPAQAEEPAAVQTAEAAAETGEAPAMEEVAEPDVTAEAEEPAAEETAEAAEEEAVEEEEAEEPSSEEAVEVEITDVIPAGYRNLLEFTDRRNVTIHPAPKPGETYDHDAELKLHLDFHIDERRKPLYQYQWAYDISDLIGDSLPLEEVSGTGAIKKDQRVFGNYTIVDGVILFTITDVYWYLLERNINGTIEFSAKLNNEENLEKTQEQINFPGAGTVNVPLTETDLESSKTVQNTAFGSPDYSTHEMEVLDNGDGTYTLCYTLTAMPNQNGGTLTLTDTLSGGQVLDTGSVTLSPASANSTITTDAGSINLTITNPVKETEYRLTYRTTVTEAQLRTSQTNTASWNWAGKTFEDSTEVIPTSDDKVYVEKQCYSQAGNPWSQNITARIDANASTTTNFTDTQSYNGSYNVVPNDDGTYTVYYQVKARAGSDLGTLSMTDGMSGGQTYNNDARITVNGRESGSVTPSGNGFSASFTDVKKNDEIVITYSATYTDEQLDQLQSNTAQVQWAGEPITLTTEFTPTLDRTAEVTKSVIAQDGTEPVKGRIVVTPSEDNKYVLTYTITCDTASDLASLTMTDRIGDNQTFVPDSFVLKTMSGNTEVSSTSVTPNISGQTFTYEMGAVNKDYKYVLTYDAVVEVHEWENIEDGVYANNNVKFTTGDTQVGESSVSVTVGTEVPEIPLEKSVVDQDGADANNNEEPKKPGDELTFTVTVGGDDVNLAGAIVIDTISNYGELVGDIVLTAPDGSTTVVPASQISDDHNGMDAQVFQYTFPSGAPIMGEHTFTYTVKVLPFPYGTGEKTLNNTVTLNYDATASTATKLFFPDKGTIDKALDHWDPDTKQIIYTVTVEVNEGAVLQNARIVETLYKFNQYPNNPYGTDMSLLLNQAKIVGADGREYVRGRDYTVSGSEFRFPTLDQSITITLAVQSPVAFDSVSQFFAYNWIELHDSNSKIDEAKTEDQFVVTDYGFEKTGEIDGNNVATWTVTINPSKILLPGEANHEPILTDTLPEGMELVPGSFTISASIAAGSAVDVNGNIVWLSDRTVTVPDREIPVSGGVIGPMNLNAAVWKGMYTAVYGINAECLTVTYKTRPTPEMMQSIVNNKDSYSFTNTATDDYYEDDATVTVHYEDVITKEDRGVSFGEIITYRITVNRNGELLHGGENIVVTDRIPSNVELVLNTYSVTDLRGNELPAGTYRFGYNDDTRTIEVTLPDETPAVINYQVIASESTGTGTAVFSNTAVFHGDFEDSSSVSEEHQINKSGGSITGEHESISLHKVDEYDLRKDLPGAKFDLYHCEFDDDFNIISTRKVKSGETDERGTLLLEEITPYELYYWVETNPPTGYSISTTGPHYFITYLVGETEEETAANQALAKSLDNDIQAANAGIIVNTARDEYVWTVVNQKNSSVDVVLEGTKTLTGRDMTEGEFTFEVYEGDELVSTGTNAGALDGEAAGIDFEAITYTEEGTHTYTVREVHPEDSQVQQTGTVEFTVTVVVSRNDIGDLIYEITEDSDEIGFTNLLTKVRVSKIDVADGSELEGATIQILDSEGTVVEEWVSTDEAHTVEGLKVGEEYTLKETVAPEGYTVTSETTFTIAEDGSVTTTGNTTTDDEGNTVLLVEDAKTKVSVSKVDIADGSELEGATIQILDSEGTVVEEWVSTDEAH